MRPPAQLNVNDSHVKTLGFQLLPRHPHGNQPANLNGVLHIYSRLAPTVPLATTSWFYLHMLNLRNGQPDRAKWGSIGGFQSQWLAYFHWVQSAWFDHRSSMLSSSNYHGDEKAEAPFRICEVGFGPGLSALLFLVATTSGEPTSTADPWKHGAEVINFDLGQMPGDLYGPAKAVAYRYIRNTFGQRRFRSIVGDSTKTVPEFARSHPASCNVIHIDGNHGHRGVLTDLRKTRALATRNTILLMDDVSMPGVRHAIDDACRQRLIRIEKVNAETGLMDSLLSSAWHAENTPSTKQYSRGRYLV